jgi:hypothetical protein
LPIAQQAWLCCIAGRQIARWMLLVATLPREGDNS